MRNTIAILVLTTMFCLSCNFSKGVKKDLKTGLSYSYNGFKVENVVALDSYQKALSSNKLPEGSVLYLLMSNVENYTTVDGKAYLGCSLKVTDVEGNVVFSNDDLYKGTEGIDIAQAHNPIVSVRLANPIVAGKTYTVEAHFYDKKKPENVIDTKIDIELIPSLVNIQHKENGLSFEDIWFSEEKGKLPENKVKIGSTAAIFLKGLKGFTEEEGKVYPGCRLIVTDKDGNTMLKYDDLFANQDGASPDVVYESFYTTVTYDNPITADKTYNVDMYVFDKKNTNNSIQINMAVEVIK